MARYITIGDATYSVETIEQIEIAERALRNAGIDTARVIASPHPIDWIEEHGDPDAVTTSSVVIAAKDHEP